MTAFPDLFLPRHHPSSNNSNKPQTGKFMDYQAHRYFAGLAVVSYLMDTRTL